MATWNHGYRDYNDSLGKYVESDPIGWLRALLPMLTWPIIRSGLEEVFGTATENGFAAYTGLMVISGTILARRLNMVSRPVRRAGRRDAGAPIDIQI